MNMYQISSPDGSVELCFAEKDGQILWSTRKNGVTLSDAAPLGLVTPDTDFGSGLKITDVRTGSIDKSYTIPAYKKALCIDRCNTVTLTAENAGGTMIIEGRAYDDGAAFRLILPEEYEVVRELSSFRVPENVEAVTGMKWLCSYEDQYHPVPVEDLYQNLLVFPVLLRPGKDLFAVYAEAAVFGNYCGSTLGAEKEDPRTMTVMKAVDQLENIKSDCPITTPWRVVIAGTLAEITDSNLLENLNPEPIVDDPSFIRPGIAAWSWMSEHDSCEDEQRQLDYVDMAAEMGWPYSVADGNWAGHVDIPKLVDYAAKKNVKIWIWDPSARLRDPEEAERKLALWKSWGVVGVKIDFFESDSQKRIAQMGMLAEIAAKHRLMLNFHGCTKPSGTIRVWPHILSYEGVQGGEYLANFSSFSPGGPDAAHNCTLPFTRNLMGPMDYTPVCYESYITGTTDAHQTALPVIFLSYIMHCGEGKEKVERNICKEFLKKLYTTWDEGKLLEGSPANYVTMARRHGEEWFVGGICARRPRNAEFTLDFLDDGIYEAELYADDLSDLRPTDTARGAIGEMTPEIVASLEAMAMRPTQHAHDPHRTRVDHFTVRKGDRLMIPESANGGFALYLKKK